MDELCEKDRVGFEWKVVLTVGSHGVSVKENCAFFLNYSDKAFQEVIPRLAAVPGSEQA